MNLCSYELFIWMENSGSTYLLLARVQRVLEPAKEVGESSLEARRGRAFGNANFLVVEISKLITKLNVFTWFVTKFRVKADGTLHEILFNIEESIRDLTRARNGNATNR